MIDNVIKILRQLMSGVVEFEAKGYPIKLSTNGKLAFELRNEKDGSVFISFVEDKTVIAEVKKILNFTLYIEYVNISKDNQFATVKLNGSLFNKEIKVNLRELQEILNKKK